MNEYDNFPQCERCRKYDVGISGERKIVEQIREEILGDIKKANYTHPNSPETEGLEFNYDFHCKWCLDERLRRAEREKEKDKNFLNSKGIDPKSVLEEE